MKGKHLIITFLVLYLLLGGITVCVYANDLGYFQKNEDTMASAESANTPVKETVSAPEVVPAVTGNVEGEEAVTVTETVTETAAPEPAEIVTEEGYPEDPGKEEDPVEASSEAAPTEESTAESTAESAAEESVAEESAQAEASGEYVFGNGKYYKYTVTEIPFEDLAIHPDVDGHNGQIGYRKPGDTGYVIGRGQWRTLIEYEGKFGYISNKYSILTEVSASEYPEELKKYSWDGTNASARSLVGAIPEYEDHNTEDLKN